MKTDSFSHKWRTAAGANAASYLEMLLRDKFDDMMTSLIGLHPILKMYFDSDLSSEIEDNAFLAISDAVMSAVEDLTKEGILSNYHDLGVAIAHTVCKRLYFLKLIYYVNSGWINKDKFCELAAEHFAVETATLINMLWGMLPALSEVSIIGVLTYLGVDPVNAKQYADRINGVIMFFYPFVKKYITKERIEELLKSVMDFTLTSARQVVLSIENLENRLKQWGRNICKTFGWNVPDFLQEIEQTEIQNRTKMKIKSETARMKIKTKVEKEWMKSMPREPKEKEMGKDVFK